MKDNSVSIKLYQATWDILDEIHKDTGINKSTQISNLIKNTIENKESVIKNNIDELEKIATAKLEEAERLFRLKDDAVSQKQHVESVKQKYVEPKPKPKQEKVVYVEEKEKKPSTNWKLYTSLKYDDGLCFPILKAIAKRHPELKNQSKSKYMNNFYSIRGERILDMFKTEEMNVFEISTREMIQDKRGKHKIRRMSIQNVIVQLLKGFYWHGNKQEVQAIFGEH